MGSVLMLCVNSWNYDAADALAKSHSPETTKLFAALRAEQARMLVFHIVNEASRSYGTAWEIMQFVIGLAAALALFLERRTRWYPIGIGLMLLLVLFEWFVILPQLDWLGRSVDFVPSKVNSPTRDQYWNLRAVFLGMESLKLLIGAGLTVTLLSIRSRTRGQPREQVETETNPGSSDARPRSLRRRRTSSKSRRSGEHPTGT